MTEKLLKPEEVAAHLAVSPKSVRQWLREGRIKGLRAGKLWRIKPAELERFLHVHVVVDNPRAGVDDRLTGDDLDWLEVDASRLDRFEPYEWKEGELDAGHPIRLVPQRGLVIDRGRDEQ